ncbi:MAG: beta strand repeat-containing protein, partial [Cyanobacteriota bacterium]
EITLGSGSSSVSGSDAGDRLEIDASSLSEEVTLSSSGAADQVVSGVVGDISASGLEGDLTVATSDATDNTINISTGNNDTTISASGDGDVVSVNAEDMAAGTTLDLGGSADFAVRDVVADTDASGTSGDVSVSYGSVEGEASIESGTGSLSISGSDSGDTLNIDASRMGEGEVLSASGAASQEVSGIVGDISASGLEGDLIVTTGYAEDGEINISTGSSNTTISASGEGDVVTIDAAAMDADSTLALSGTATFAATELEANIDASGTSGEVTLSYGAVSDGAAEITTGSGTTTISGSEAGDQLVIDASKLDASATLSQSGEADQLVSGLVGDISASGLSGELTVNSGDSTDNAIRISTGSSNTTIVGTGSDDTISVDGDVMLDNTMLELSGGASFVVTNLEGNADLSGTSGEVSLNYGNVGDGVASISLGSGSSSVSGIDSGDRLEINASLLSEDVTLSASGATSQEVSGVTATIDASGLSGELTVTTGDSTDNAILISTGSNDTTINASGDGDVVSVNAEEMAVGTTLDMRGSAEFAITDVVANTDASASTGSVSVSYGEVGGEASIQTGSGSLSISGGASEDTLVIDASRMGEGGVLNSSGVSSQIVSGVVATIDASGLSGELTLTTGNAADDRISITLGTGDTTIVGTSRDDTISLIGDLRLDNRKLDLSGLSSFEVTGGLEGDVDISGLSGNMSLITSDATDNQINITLGSGDARVFGSGSDDTISIIGDVMLDNSTLKLSGIASFEVSGLAGNADLSGATGQVSLSYGDVDDGVADITLGSGSSSVSGSDAGDTLRIDASVLSEDGSLSASGAASQEVSGVVATIDASGLSGELTVTTGDSTDNAILISTGSNDTTIIATGSDDTISVDGDVMLDNTMLELSGGASFVVTNLEGNADLSGTSGEVSLNYGNLGDGLALITLGSGSSSVSGSDEGDTLLIDASALSEDVSLSASGAASQEVSGIVGDISANGLSGELTVTTSDATDNTINISTGSNDTTISASGDGDVVSVNAEDMAAGTTLDLSGSADFAVSDVVADTDASGTSGEVSVSYGSVEGEASIESGSGSLSISGSGSGYTLNIDASLMGEGEVLSSSGAADQEVSGVVGDISASGLEGDLIVTTGDAEDGEINISTGSSNTTISASGVGDVVTIDAASIGEDSTLDLSGNAEFVVRDVVADTDASGTSGDVSVSYGEVGGEATITTGSGNTTISGSGSDDTLTVNATSLGSNTLLSLFGAAKQVVTNLVGNITGSNLTGSLEVSTSDSLDNEISISTGSADTTISASGAGDVVTIDAGSMGGDSTLALSGTATFAATELEANTDASGTSGEVTLSYGAVSDGAAEITTGSGTTTISGSMAGDQLVIDASMLDASATLSQSGAADQLVSGLVGDISASGLSGELTVTTGNAADDQISISTGSADSTISASGADDVVTIDAAAMDADSTLALSGTATFAATDLQANADASGTSGEVTLSYGAVSDGAAEIKTGSGTTTISGTEAGDQLVIDASKLDASATLSQSGAADQLVSGLVGDISASGLSGGLTVTTGNAADDQISISTGSADSTISASGADDVVTI